MAKWSDDGSKKVLVLACSPRHDGNSRLMASSFADGAREAGHQAIVVDVPQYVRHMLQYCKDCRGSDGECVLDDDYREILLDLYLPADAVVFATPIWWYGISAHLKNFIDRLYCYISDSSPYGARTKSALQGKPTALLLSAEENGFAARLAIVAHMSELCRYLHCPFVGVVTGTGNLRGEVTRDPAGPVEAARAMGARLFDMNETDYHIDTPRGPSVWPEGAQTWPAYWR